MNATTTTATAKALHPFERAGLGLAPFRFVGAYESRGPIKRPDGSEIGAPGQPMGCCQYCGQGIAICCTIKSSDGKRFTVGSDCVAKVDRDSNRKSDATSRDPLAQEVRRAVNAIKLEKRHQREAEQLAAGREWIAANLGTLASLLSERDGETLADRWEWFSANAGTAGKLRLLKELRAAVDAADVTPEAIAQGKAQATAKAARVAADKLCAQIRHDTRQWAKTRKRATAAAENAWLVDAIQGQPGDFVADMCEKLQREPLRDLSPRCVDILGDIFSKTLGRRNSKAYNSARDEFDERAGLEC